MPNRNQHHSGNGRHPRRDAQQDWDPALRILTDFQDPMLRYADIPGASVLAEHRMLAPDDAYLRDIHAHLQQDQIRKAFLGGPFHANDPPAGSLPPLEKGRIPIAQLATGDVLSIPLLALTRNVLVVGPTGSGKTNWLRILLACVLEAEA